MSLITLYREYGYAQMHTCTMHLCSRLRWTLELAHQLLVSQEHPIYWATVQFNTKSRISMLCICSSAYIFDGAFVRVYLCIFRYSVRDFAQSLLAADPFEWRIWFITLSYVDVILVELCIMLALGICWMYTILTLSLCIERNNFVCTECFFFRYFHI